MTKTDAYPLIAVDVGNSRIKLGLFTGPTSNALPVPAATLDLDLSEGQFNRLDDWLESRQLQSASWFIVSVNRAGATRLIDHVREGDVRGPLAMLGSGDMPLEVRLEHPDRVGLDRLAAVVAANRIRRPDQPAVVADLGSAITVDVVSVDGAFLNGAILPGIAMSARAMHEFTDLLPLVKLDDIGQPAAVGNSTVEAMRSGLYWGAIGAVKELVARAHADASCPPKVIISGGWSAAVAGLISDSAEHVPHLVLSGIALAAGG